MYFIDQCILSYSIKGFIYLYIHTYIYIYIYIYIYKEITLTSSGGLLLKDAYIFHKQWKKFDTHRNQKVRIQTGFQIVNYIHWSIVEDTYLQINVFVFKDLLPIDLFKSLLDQEFIRRWVFNKNIKFTKNDLVMEIWKKWWTPM